MFDGLVYTREALARELYEIQLHATDGSAVSAHCGCIQEKHLLGVEGIAGEGVTLAKDEKERAFYTKLVVWANETKNYILEHVHSWTPPQEAEYYMNLGLTARNLRATIQSDDFNFESVKCGCVGCPRCVAKIEK